MPAACLQPCRRGMLVHQACEPGFSGRCLPAALPARRLRQTGALGRSAAVVRAEFSRGPQQPGPGPETLQQPWRGNYQYAPASTQAPPRLPPTDGPGGGPAGGGGGGGLSNLTKAFIAGAFILGMGAGILFDAEVTFAPTNVASTVLVDTKTPNSEVCMANGYSSMVFDQRIFVSFNPFNVYVSQPQVKPGCVLRRSNVGVLESRGLVDGSAVSACKRNMNTFAFVGDLEGRPEVSCVYHSEEAENEFLRGKGSMMRGGTADGLAEQR